MNSSVDKYVLINIFLIKNYIREILNCNNPVKFQSGYIVNLTTGDVRIYAYSNIENFDLVSPINLISDDAIEDIKFLMYSRKPSSHPLNGHENISVYIDEID